MKTQPITLAAVALLICNVARAQESAGTPGDPIIDKCKVILVDDYDVEIPANDLGTLTYLGVKIGSEVEEGEIAKIDDRQAIIAREAAKYGLRAANARATSDIERQHATAAAAVAKETYEGMKRSNTGVKGSVTQTDLREKELEWKRSELAIEKATHDMALAAMDAWVKKAELDAAELAIDLRTVKAPFSGQVAEVYRSQNEWVNKGDPILRLIRLDTLYVDGALYLDEYNPREIRGCEVTVEVPIGRGEVAQIPGRIMHVNPELRYGERQQYVVRAEITNRSENDQWLVLPGQQVTMKIHLGTATPAVMR